MKPTNGAKRPAYFTLATDHFHPANMRKPARQQPEAVDSCPEPHVKQAARQVTQADTAPAKAERPIPVLVRTSDPAPASDRAPSIVSPAQSSGPVIASHDTPPVATPAERAKAIARQATAAGRRVMGKAGRGAAAAAAWSGKAARWSGAKGRSLAESAKRLMSSVSTPRIDPLKELADSARYAAVSNRLNAIASLSPIEIEKLRNSLPDRRIHQAGSELRVEGESADSALFIATGWAARIRMSPRGRRQIVGFLVAGDGIALHTSPGAINNTTVVALTSVETVSADGVLKMARDRSAHPRISEAITRLCAADDALLVNQVMRLGALEAPDRLAHLLLELHWRLQVAGLATDQLFPLPLNLDTLSDALNLRPRSVQRILFQFERRGFIKRGYGRILIRQADRLAKLSGFAPPTLAISESARRLVRDIHGETGTGLAASDKPTQAPSELELGPDMVVDPPPAPRRSSAGSSRS